jgi:O-antigen/teichoic acid export membrane protein
MTLDEREARAEAVSIGSKAGRGLRWSFLGTLATKVGSFAMGLVLARLLTPADFGMYAIALAATQFVMHINDAGIIAATVQWRGRLEEMVATATTMAIVFSTGVYAIFWFLAPSFAALSGSPEATGVVRLLTAVILIDGITAVRAGTLLRRFEQHKLMMANACGFVVNATLAITLAANGAGPYSFAVGQLAASVVTGVVVWIRAALPFQLDLDRAVSRRLLKFGLPLAVSLGIEAVLVNADYVIVGDLLGPEALGYYLLAFNVSTWVPGLIGTAVRWVSIPSFSRLAENDVSGTDTLSVGVQRSVPLLLAVVLPLAVLMATLAHPMIALLYGERWDQAAGVLRFLAVLMIGRMLISLAFDILTSQGNTRATVWLNLSWAVVLVPVLYYAASVDGIRGAAIGHAVVVLVVALPLAVLALHRAGVRMLPMWPRLVRPVLGAVLSGVVIIVVGRLVGPGVLLPLVVAGGAGVLVYAAIVGPQILAARKESLV